MANDIAAAKSTNPVKNGTLITSTSPLGVYSKSDLYVQNKPTIATIANKYDNRFDDPSYYYGIGNTTIVGG